MLCSPEIDALAWALRARGAEVEAERAAIGGSGTLFTLMLVLGILVATSEQRHGTANWTL